MGASPIIGFWRSGTTMKRGNRFKDLPADLKGILFDVGETLVRIEPSRSVIFGALLRRRGIEVSVEQVKKAYMAADEYWATKYADRPLHETQTPNVLIEVNLFVLRELGIHDASEGLAKYIVRNWRKRYRHSLYDDVLLCLKWLRTHGVKLGIASNAESNEEVDRKLRQLGIAHFFDSITVSGTFDIGKPSARFFQIAVDRIGLPHEKLVHVGNDVVYDVWGAMKAEIVPILLDRDDDSATMDCIRIRSLAELPKVLRRVLPRSHKR